MIRLPLVSSMLRSIAYDPDARVLVVEFTNGNRYAYVDVPPDICDEMAAAPSVGRFFHARVRAVFRYRRL